LAKAVIGALPGLFQALIQFVADFAGEPGDFTIAGIHNLEGVCCCFNISVFRHGLI
jgi:hypothetical protein